MERTIGKAVAQAVNGKPGDMTEDQPSPSAAATPDECCGRCKYMAQVVQFNSFSKVCRRRPPQLVAIPQQTPQGVNMSIVSMFPAVDEPSVCGEFVRRADG